MSKSNPQNTSKTQRTVLGGLSGLIIIIIVLFLQYGLGIDLLEEDGKDTGTTDPGIDQPVDVFPPVIDLGPDINLTPIPGGYDGGWFQVYFTNPNGFTASMSMR
ncbi:MAG: hypothetical protein K8S97_14985, partial [Anaerolineae bacterium]|nr:hypothetical protein [Anaerolineae bacterium]